MVMRERKGKMKIEGKGKIMMEKEGKKGRGKDPATPVGPWGQMFDKHKLYIAALSDIIGDKQSEKE